MSMTMSFAFKAKLLREAKIGGASVTFTRRNGEPSPLALTLTVGADGVARSERLGEPLILDSGDTYRVASNDGDFSMSGFVGEFTDIPKGVAGYTVTLWDVIVSVRSDSEPMTEAKTTQIESWYLVEAQRIEGRWGPERELATLADVEEWLSETAGWFIRTRVFLVTRATTREPVQTGRE